MTLTKENLEKLYTSFNNNDVVEFSNIVKNEKLSLNDIEWNICHLYRVDTIKLKDFLLINADNILGDFYEQRD